MVLTGYNEPLEYKSVPEPAPGDDDIILKVRAAGLCSTDIKITTGLLAGFVNLPHIPGHEIAGEIVAVGRNVGGLKPGDFGAAYPVIGCGRCRYCLTGNENLCIDTVRLGFETDGGFAEFVRLPAANFCSASKSVAPEKVAVLADAAGTPYHALTRIAVPTVGMPVLIMGAGGLGLNAVQIAKRMGSFVIVCDIRDSALEAARSFSADICINTLTAEDPAAEILDATGGIGVGIVLEGVGRQDSFSLGLRCLRKQGTLIVMGYNPAADIAVPFIELHNRELKIAGTKICTRNDLNDVIRLVESGVIDPLIFDTYGLEQLNEGLAAVAAGGIVGRICIDFQGA